MDRFVVPRTIYKLRFTDDQYAGLVVRARRMDLGTVLRGGTDTSWTANESLTPAERVERLDSLHRTFVEHLVDWNLTEEDGSPVPGTFDGLRSLEGEFVSALIGAWLYTPTSVDVPLDKPSSDGDPSLEASMTTVTLSPSLAS
jgi:hypothetical protein